MVAGGARFRRFPGEFSDGTGGDSGGKGYGEVQHVGGHLSCVECSAGGGLAVEVAAAAQNAASAAAHTEGKARGE